MLDSVDIIIFSTSSKTPLLTDDDLKNFDNQRKDKIILVDLSVPRNIVIEKTYEKIELVDLDKLKDKVNENYNKRISEVNKAQEMIEKFIDDFVGWVDSRELRPTIISIKKEIKNLISGSSEKTKENKQIEDIYDKLSDKLVKKIISVSNNGKNADALKIINKIFVSDE
jgi:glutamyl-tRNA reductase